MRSADIAGYTFPVSSRPKSSAGDGEQRHQFARTIARMTLAMMRDDWWWPWWVSSLIDLGIVAIAVAVFVVSSRRIVRLIAGTLVLAGLVAAVMAPIVMTEDSDEPTMERMQPGEGPTMLP